MDRRDALEAAELLEAVRAFAASLPAGAILEEEIDSSIAERLGVIATEPIAVVTSDYNGVALLTVMPSDCLAFAERRMRLADDFCEIGEHEKAERARDLARLACSDALRGIASQELLGRQYEDDGDPLQPSVDAGYDEACDLAGGVELLDAVVIRPARLTLGARGPRAPVRVRRPARRPVRRARRRERRARRSRAPARSTGDDPSHADLAARRRR
jgi:hypothetical protein